MDHADTLHIIDTPNALVQRTAPDLVEVRFKPGSALNVEGIGALLDARAAMDREALQQVRGHSAAKKY